MDESRFDALTRTFAISRRQALKLAVGGTMAGLIELTGGSSGRAARRGFSGPFSDPTPTPGCVIDGVTIPAGAFATPQGCLVCDPELSTTEWSSVEDGAVCGGVLGRVCCNGECCSPTECCEGIGVCTECGPHCRIAGVDVDAGVVNPSDECQICDPERSLDDWSPLDDGRSCDGGNGCCHEGDCGICFCEIDGDPVANGEHNPNNDCEACRYFIDPTAWTNRDNSATCGNDGDRRCCDGRCCPPGNCCTLDGCEPCCRIGSDIVTDGAVNPRNTCQVCDANRNPDDWTTLENGNSCGATGNSECCEGACCPTGQCCRNGACDLCDCEIDGQRFEPDDINENNPCEICKPAQNRFGWSAVTAGTSCGSNGATCCGGDCCSSEHCCLLEACGECLCSIENEIYEPRDPNPDVACQECDPATNPFDWSTSPDRTPCGDGSQICCGGDCCDAGLCCLDGSCRACGCLIDGIPVEDGAIDPANPCQRCAAEIDPAAWTLLDDGATCGDSGAQCCTGGQCDFCNCLIDGVVIPDGDPNPANICEQCDVALFAGDWSPRNETHTCGNGNQLCCNGICCDEGLCCGLDDLCNACGCLIDGVSYPDGTPNPRNRCEVCMAAFPDAWSPRSFPDCPTPCLIDGQIYPSGTPNPANPCEICHGGEAWSPSTSIFCGSGEALRVCCNGVCCESGACCSESGLCAFDACQLQGCVIDGVQFEDGAPNPSNPCQLCNIAQSTTAWSAQLGPCGENGDRFCCNGICCELGACCSPDQVCDFDICQTCAIDGVLWFPEDLNPANTCEWCISNANKFAWTTKPDNFFCDELQLTVCCNGSCCEAGMRCSGGSCQPA